MEAAEKIDNGYLRALKNAHLLSLIDGDVVERGKLPGQQFHQIDGAVPAGFYGVGKLAPIFGAEDVSHFVDVEDAAFH